MPIEKFVSRLSVKGKIPTYTFEEGSSSEFYLADHYVEIIFDSDIDGKLDSELEVVVDAENMVSTESKARLMECIDELKNEEQGTGAKAVSVCVPSVVGKKLEEIEKILQELGLNQVIVESGYDKSNEEGGYVYTQNILAGKNVAKGTEIIIEVSKPGLIMPDLIGMPKEQAVERLKALKFNVYVDEIYSETVESGNVINQSIKAGARYNPDIPGDIEIEVSKAKMRNVVGLSKEQAVSELEDLGFKVKLERINSDVVQKGIVISQSIEAGSEYILDENSEIYLYVSNGKQSELPAGTVKVNSDLFQYQNMSYGEFKERIGKTLDYWRNNIFSAQLPDEELEIVFLASYFDEVTWYQVQDHDKCYRLQGNLQTLVDGITGEMTIDEIVSGLAQGNQVPMYSIAEGYVGGYSVSERYVVISFDSDGDGQRDAVLHIDIGEDEVLSQESEAWLFFGVMDGFETTR